MRLRKGNSLMRYVNRRLPALAVAAALLMPLPESASSQATVPAENAAAMYKKAFALLPELSDKEARLLGERGRWKAGRAEAVALGVVNKSAPALKLLLEAGRCKRCDWPIYEKDRIERFLPRLSKTRPLALLAFLRARYHFAQNNSRAAIEDLAAAMTLGRRSGPGGPIVALIVQNAIENTAAETAANHLAELSPAELKALAARLDAVPKGADLTDTLRWEKRVCEKQQNHYPMFKQAAEFYEAAARIAHLPPDQFAEKLERTKEPPGAQLAPTVRSVSYTHAATKAKMLMLKAAIAALLVDSKALKSIKDPYGDGPFERKHLKKGFQLTSKLRVRGKPVTLTIPGRD